MSDEEKKKPFRQRMLDKAKRGINSVTNQAGHETGHILANSQGQAYGGPSVLAAGNNAIAAMGAVRGVANSVASAASKFGSAASGTVTSLAGPLFGGGNKNKNKSKRNKTKRRRIKRNKRNKRNKRTKRR